MLQLCCHLVAAVTAPKLLNGSNMGSSTVIHSMHQLRTTECHLVAAVAASKLLNGLVSTPRQLQRDVAAPPLVAHAAQRTIKQQTQTAQSIIGGGPRMAVDSRIDKLLTRFVLGAARLHNKTLAWPGTPQTRAETLAKIRGDGGPRMAV
jgi:hypothetical protein